MAGSDPADGDNVVVSWTNTAFNQDRAALRAEMAARADLTIVPRRAACHGRSGGGEV